MTEFMKQNSDLSWGRDHVLCHENYMYEIVDIENFKSAFCNRCPRKNSKYATCDYLVRNLKENRRVIY